MKQYAIFCAIIATILFPFVALASVITGATYHGTVIVTNNSTAANNVIVPFSLNTASLITEGMANSSLNNTAIKSGATDIVYCPEYGTTNWWMFAGNMTALTANSYDFYSGGAASMVSALYYIPGANGMYVADSVSLDLLGNTYSIEVDTYLDSLTTGTIWTYQDTGADKVKLYVPSSNNVTFWVNGWAPFDVSKIVTSGYHKYRVTNDNTNIYLYIDDVMQSYAATIGAIGNFKDWYIGGPPTLYITSANITIAGVEQAHWHYTYGATFTDLTGNGHPGTPTYPTAVSDPDVSANLTSLAPITQAQLTNFCVASTGSILTGNATAPSQLYVSGNFSNIPGASAINELLDTSGTPRGLWWDAFLYLFIAVLAGILYEPTSGGNKSVFMMCVLIEALFVLFGIMGPIPFDNAVYFPMAAFAIISSQKHFGLG